MDHAAATGLDAPVTASDVAGLFELILRRTLDNPEYGHHLAASGATLGQVIAQLRASPELANRMQMEYRPAPADAADFRCPTALRVVPTRPERLLVVGSCLAHLWTDRIALLPDGAPSELYLFGTDLPPRPQLPPDRYDLMIVQPPLRFVLPDGAFAALAQSDLQAHRDLLDHCMQATTMLLHGAMAWNRAHGIPTMVFAFLTPQQNPVSRLLPRHDLRNPVFFIERLNHHLAKQTLAHGNAWFFDINEVVSTHGRRFLQEDMVTQLNHGSMMIDFDHQHDHGRLDPPRKLSEVYEQRLTVIAAAVWAELVAMLRTIRQTDAVKMVVIDLDDTLWRGVAAELDADDLPTAEGWPKGFWEALRLLKRRGILLAIISQNDEARIRQLWHGILGTLLSLDDFAVHRIDWRPKPEKMAEILATVNLLPHSVVYIDDNPAQRAELAAAFAGLRVLGGDPFTWRHILLWAPETQLARFTPESARRTDMVRAQAAREATRASLPRADFLASLCVRMHWLEIATVSHPRFGRALELINKTNQFNTTGQRWTQPDCITAFAAGTVFLAFEVTDRFTDYGLVGVLILDQTGIAQFVMSCRVLGMEVERAALAAVEAKFSAQGKTAIAAAMIHTERNLPCRALYPQAGYHQHGADRWIKTL